MLMRHFSFDLYSYKKKKVYNIGKDYLCTKNKRIYTLTKKTGNSQKLMLTLVISNIGNGIIIYFFFFTLLAFFEFSTTNI